MFSNWKQKFNPTPSSSTGSESQINNHNLNFMSSSLKNRSHLMNTLSEKEKEDEKLKLNQRDLEIIQEKSKNYGQLPKPMISKKSMLWGEPTWTLFHTLAQKIDENHFSQLSKELFDLIKTICHTLPCPDCAMHASQYVSKVNWSGIRSKRELIALLWDFHNEVNKRKGYAAFPFEKVEETYGGKNMVEVIRVFMYHYEDKYSKGPNSAIASKFHRQRIAFRLKVWFNQNIQYFGLSQQQQQQGLD